MVKYGKTWWGEMWLNALKNIDYTNRLPRGKTYANTGKVFDIKVKKNKVSGRVLGNYAPYYKVWVKFQRFSEKEKEIIIDLINNSPSILSSLLNHELPLELYYKLSQKGIELFPQSSKDIEFDCNCPDYAPVCKHIAGLIYMISVEIDKDPFNVFKFHDCNLIKLLDSSKKLEYGDIFKIKKITDVLEFDETREIEENHKRFNKYIKEKFSDLEENNLETELEESELEENKLEKIDLEENKLKESNLEETNLEESDLNEIRKEVLNEIDFSNIPDLLEINFNMLKEKPLFFEKDFKEILKKNYKSMSTYCRKESLFVNSHHEGMYNDHIILKTKKSNKIKYFNPKKESHEEFLKRYFLTKWENPHLWEKFTININTKYEIRDIFIDENNATKNPFILKNHEKLEVLLYSFLVERDFTYINEYNYNIQFLDLLYHFTMELIKKHGIIPEIVEVKNKRFIIRWIPSQLNENIEEIIEKLALICPDNFLTLNSKKINKKEQIISGISLLIFGFIEKYKKFKMPKMMRKHLPKPVFSIFFGESQNFNEFQTKGFQHLINQWLSNFHMKERDYELFLTVEEDNDVFSINFKASVDDNPPKNLSELISNDKEDKTKEDEIKEDKEDKSKEDDENKKTQDIEDEGKLQLLSDIYLINKFIPQLNNAIDLKKDIVFNFEDFSEFFINIIPVLELLGISIILPKTMKHIYKPQLVLDFTEKPMAQDKSYLSFEEIIEFDWRIAIGHHNYSKEEFEELLRKSEGLVKLAEDYVILDKKDMESLLKNIKKIPENLNQNDLMKAVLSGEFEDIDVNISEELKLLVENINKKVDYKVPKTLNGELREYQKLGYSWLLQNINTGFGSILADDMGLGKTIQTLATILYLKENDYLDEEKVLIIVPTSLLYNWQREIEKFTPSLKCHVYHGSKRKLPDEEYHILLSSYGILREDKNLFKKKKWFLMVIDEAQNIKNPLTKQSRAIKSIDARSKIALTGTPVENRLYEYWSIFDYINKNYLGTVKNFRKEFVVPIEKERNHKALSIFKKITSPFILRRLKTDKSIINDLPDKIVNDVYCNLTGKQVGLYEKTLKSLMRKIKGEEGIDRNGLILKLIGSLKQICNHPAQFTKSKKVSIEDSGKMTILLDILDNINKNEEKVLIFTQYVQMGDIIKKLVEDKFNTEVLFLHGGLSRKQRDEMVNEFQNNSQKRIFILSLKAGGTGLNLTAAQNVIHYDLWWNPAVEDQATDRAYRIGQDKNVMVYRLISSGTFEEQINRMIRDKRELADLTVVKEEKFITEMSDKELKEILNLRK